MYNKIKKYINTDRIINEDNDYLLKEEYDSLLAIKNSYSDVCQMLEIYNKYAKSQFEKLINNEDEYIVLKGVSIIKPDKYDTRSNNGISFTVDIRTRNKKFLEGYPYKDYIIRSDINHHERGFNPRFIKTYYGLLKKIAQNESVSIGSYKYDDYAHFSFRQEFINKITIIENDMSYIYELIEYYKDKIIVIEQDKRLLDELKELDDFFENL